jgi:NAD(P)-dependent dehydrogenase (short-subunit alcohol dehydrogenase family)
MTDTSEQTLMYATYPDRAGKRGVVTDGGSLIGRELVNAFAGQGAFVWYLDATVETGGPVDELRSAPSRAPRYVPCDLTGIDSIRAAFAAIEEAAGAVDILLNNTDVGDRHRIDKVSEDVWERWMAADLRNKFSSSQAVIPGMKTQGRGVILTFGSTSWGLASSRSSLAQAAKEAVLGMTRSLARDLGGFDIRANTVLPAAWTPWSPSEEGGRSVRRTRSRDPRRRAGHGRADAASRVGQRSLLPRRRVAIAAPFHQVRFDGHIAVEPRSVFQQLCSVKFR